MDWKPLIKRIAVATGSAMLFLARHLWAWLLALARFILLRAIPATWRWLRGTALPGLRRFYLWLPHRRRVAAVAACAVVAVVGLAVLRLPQDEGAPAAADGTGIMASIREAIRLPGAGPDRVKAKAPIEVSARHAKLVDTLLDGDWTGQKDATRTVLESIGATVLGDDQTLPQGKGLRVIQPELLMLARDGARKRDTSRLSLAEVAQMLKDFGFPFPEGRRPAEVMAEGIRAWVARALQDPGTPGAESALFLHAMAARQQPAIDLASGNWVAEQYALTHLELFVFNAAVAGAFPDGDRSSASLWSESADLISDIVFPKAHASEVSACSIVMDLYGFGHDASKQNMQSIFGLFQSVGEMSEGAVQNLAKAASAISTLFKLHRLMLLYTSTELRVTADKSSVHKPTDSEGGRTVTFLATVGIDQEKQREFERKAKESPVMRGVGKCLASLGLPTPTDVGDLAEEMKKWEVSWNLYGDHATWSNKKNQFKSGNQRRAPLTPSADGAHGESRFIVDIKREEHHEGDVDTGYISGKATLHTDVMPGTEAVSAYAAAIDAFKNGNALAGLLGLTGTTIGLTGGLMQEVLGGWAQRILDPEVSYIVAVDYHRLRYPGYSYEGVVQVQRHFNYSKQGDNGVAMDYGPAGMRDEYEGYRYYHSNVVADMKTERASLTRYTDYKHEARWRMSGQADSSASYEVYESFVRKGKKFCPDPGPGHIVYSEESVSSGSGSSSGPSTYDMSIEQHALGKGEVRIRVQLNDAGPLVPYERKRVHTLRACSGTNSGTRTEWTASLMTSAGSTGHTYTVSEPFPERISGSKTVTSEDGRGSTTWTWNFHRVGPFEESEGKPKAGRRR